MKIRGFSPKSAALKAGLKEGDILLFIEEWGIESIEDVKITLFDKKHGETIKVKASRKRFPLGKKMLKFHVIL